MSRTKDEAVSIYPPSLLKTEQGNILGQDEAALYSTQELHDEHGSNLQVDQFSARWRDGLEIGGALKTIERTESHSWGIH